MKMEREKSDRVQPRLKLHSFIVNDGNIVAATAVVRLFVDGVEKEYVGRAEHAIEAILRAIDKLIKVDVSMESYHIDVTSQEDRLLAKATVRIRIASCVYVGESQGIDAVEAVIKAYLHALNQYF